MTPHTTHISGPVELAFNLTGSADGRNIGLAVEISDILDAHVSPQVG